MVLKRIFKNTVSATSKKSDTVYILILEDDPDQMELLTSFALDEMQKFYDGENTSAERKEKIAKIKIIPTTSIEVLKKAVTRHSPILLAILDCNIPDAEGREPHDQFIKQNHKITGKHKAVEVIINQNNEIPITMVSTLHRFKKLVFKYYNTNYDFNINFISKKDQEKIQNNIGYYLRQYLREG